MSLEEKDLVFLELPASTVILWLEEKLEVTDQQGVKYTVGLEKPVEVVLINLEDKREENAMPARALGEYLRRGYIVEKISFERQEAGND